jgi:hypothetical protein
MSAMVAILILSLATLCAASSRAADTDWKKVDLAFSRPGAVTGEPRAFFVHFWANDNAVKLAKGLRAALDAVHVAPKE